METQMCPMRNTHPAPAHEGALVGAVANSGLLIREDEVPEVDEIGEHRARVADGDGGEDDIDGGVAHTLGCQDEDVDHVGHHAESADRQTQPAVHWLVQSAKRRQTTHQATTPVATQESPLPEALIHRSLPRSLVQPMLSVTSDAIPGFDAENLL